MKITEKLKEMMKLHSAGAIVRNVSPFSELETPTIDGSIDAEELRKWVFPSPGAMRGLDKSDDFLKLCSSVTPEIVLNLLSEFNWRYRITAASFAAVRKFDEFDTVIGNLLLKSEVCYAGRGYCVALASFNSKYSVSSIEKYLDYYLLQKGKLFDQGEAMGALAWLDQVNNTNLISTKMRMWNEFVSNKENWKLDSFIAGFEEQMKIVQKLREQLNAT